VLEQKYMKSLISMGRYVSSQRCWSRSTQE
jgi:hypothetical protein